MSLTGKLTDFPLADVIQFLHMTAKSGILNLRGAEGECQLVFHEGFFVGANHPCNSIRIGSVLVEMEAISIEELQQALSEQSAAKERRKPLIATLVEQGRIDGKTAYRGLELLIEMTIVEVLTWVGGDFSFDVSSSFISDEYRYFPEKLERPVLLNAQGVLMDSLRIYDEKMLDGTLDRVFSNHSI